MGKPSRHKKNTQQTGASKNIPELLGFLLTFSIVESRFFQLFKCPNYNYVLVNIKIIFCSFCKKEAANLTVDRNTRPTLQHQQELMDPSSYSHSTTIIKDNPLFTSSSTTRAAFSSSGSLSNKQNSSDSLLSGFESAVSVDQSENSTGIGNNKPEDQDNIKRLCDSMRRQILARAFYGCKLMQYPEN